MSEICHSYSKNERQARKSGSKMTRSMVYLSSYPLCFEVRNNKQSSTPQRSVFDWPVTEPHSIWLSFLQSLLTILTEKIE